MVIKFKFNSPVILGFAILSLIALILGYMTGGVSTRLVFCVYRSSWADPLTYVRMFCHVLGHADISHYVNNMLYILLLGPILEEKYGSLNMLEMILITAFITGLVNTIFFPNGLLGASGIVFMMIVLASMVSFKQGQIPITMILVVILYLGNEVIAGVFTKDNISQLTHILGGVLGIVYGLAYNGSRK